MNKIVYVLSFCFAVVSLGYGQYSPKNNNRSIAYLEDGGVLLGDIISEKKNTLTLQIYTGDTVTIDKRLAKKILYTRDNIILHDNGKYHYTRGKFWSLALGFNLLTDTRPSTHLDFKYGYRLNQQWTVAGGLAFEYNRAIVSGLSFDTQFSSLYAYGRYYFSDSRPRYFVYSRLGYGFPAEDEGNTEEHSGGFQTQSGVGVHFASYKKLRFAMAFGHHLQYTNGNESFIDVFGNEIKAGFDIWISRSIFKVIMEFK